MSQLRIRTKPHFWKANEETLSATLEKQSQLQSYGGSLRIRMDQKNTDSGFYKECNKEGSEEISNYINSGIRFEKRVWRYHVSSKNK